MGAEDLVEHAEGMSAIREIGLPHQRLDFCGPFGNNLEAAYLAMNPIGLVPTLGEDDGFLLWESNTIVRYFAAKHESTHSRAGGSAHAGIDQQMDGLAARGGGPRDFGVLLGLIRTPPEKRIEGR